MSHAMNALDTTAAPSNASAPGKSPLYAIVDIAQWLWPRRRLLVAQLRAAKHRARAPKRAPARRLRFAV